MKFYEHHASYKAALNVSIVSDQDQSTLTMIHHCWPKDESGSPAVYITRETFDTQVVPLLRMHSCPAFSIAKVTTLKSIHT